MLLAYTKITVADELIAHRRCRTTRICAALLHAYFPTALRERFPEQIDSHPLRREIVTTVLVNDTVNTGGTSFLHRLREETGASLEEIVRAQTAARAIFGSGEVWDAVEALDNTVDGRCPDPDPAALAAAGRARHPLAAQQPAAAAAARRDHRLLRGAGRAGLGASCQAAAGRGPGVVPDRSTTS